MTVRLTLLTVASGKLWEKEVVSQRPFKGEYIWDHDTNFTVDYISTETNSGKINAMISSIVSDTWTDWNMSQEMGWELSKEGNT